MLNRRTILLVGVGLAGVAVGVTVSQIWEYAPQDPCQSQYALINPEPDCDTFTEQSKKLESLQDELDGAVKAAELKPDIDRVGVFIRDLATRRFAGVNDDQAFYTASLLKVPLLAAYYKFAELEPSVLSDTITYTGNPNEYALQDITVSEPLEIGKTYTIEELLRRSIIYSDNTAAQILLRRLDARILDDAIKDLGLRVTKSDGNAEDIITPRSYSNVYRSLYNASYLNREYSNKALELLSTTVFNHGAAAAIPKEVTVAHKFGQRTLVNTTNQVLARQLLDCGIVYAQKKEKPYIFCIMVEGKDYGAMENVAESVSKTVYNFLKD